MVLRTNINLNWRKILHVSLNKFFQILFVTIGYFSFKCARWLDANEGDGKTEIDLLPSSPTKGKYLLFLEPFN